MKIAISVETTADLSKELIKKYDINVIPFTIDLGEKMAKDGDITPDEIFAYVDETGILPKTSAINQFEFEEYFGKLIKKYDAIIHLSLSDRLSSAYSNACMCTRKINNLYVINSKSLSTGIGLLAIYAATLRDKGLSLTEIVEAVDKRIPYIQASFVVNTLSYLNKGGRCSSLQHLGAMLLRLKPQIVVNDGAMELGKKYRGKSSACVEEYCKDTLEEFTNPDKSIVFVTHSHASDDMIQTCVDWLKESGFKNILVTVAGATITSHCGPKTIGILFFNDGGKTLQ